MPEQNIIIGPDGQIFRPREVPTGLESHVKFVVREYEKFNLELERMVAACRASKRDEDEDEDKGDDDDGRARADLLGQILALSKAFTSPRS